MLGAGCWKNGRQKAEGGRQKTEGRRQKAEGGRRKAENRLQGTGTRKRKIKTQEGCWRRAAWTE